MKQSVATVQVHEMVAALRESIQRVIVGKDDAINLAIIALLSKGHVLVEDVPGIGKTTLAKALAQSLGCSFSRIQFTPDLMPADITGTEMIEEDRATGHRERTFVKGPIFSNIVLADEINRTPPKTQAALLEAMQERQVSAGNQKYKLDLPFFVLATQNPIEQEGTYNLPEAQLDRFMYLIVVDYPETDDEVEIMKRTTTNYEDEPQQVLEGEQILHYQKIVREVPVRDDLYDYVVSLVQATRVSRDYCLPYAKEWVEWGAGPRACQNLILGAKANSFFRGRSYVTTADIHTVAKPVLRHRIIVSYAAISEGITSDMVVEKILEEVPTPRETAEV